jgi:hypothetical protein
VSAIVPNPDVLSSFAAVRSLDLDNALDGDVINKQQGSTPAEGRLGELHDYGTS